MAKVLDGSIMRKVLNTITGLADGLDESEKLPSAVEFSETLIEKGPIKLSPEYQELFREFVKVVVEEQDKRDKEADKKL